MRGLSKPGDVWRRRTFICWAIATGCFTAGKQIDIFSITGRAEAEGWYTDEVAGEDVVRVSDVLEGVSREKFKSLPQDVVTWYMPPGQQP